MARMPNTSPKRGQSGWLETPRRSAFNDLIFGITTVDPRPVFPFTTRPATEPGIVTGTIRRAWAPGSARSVAISPG